MWPCGRCRCDPDGESGDSWHIAGVVPKTRTCARKLVTPMSEYLMRLYESWRHGNLAISGGVTDQPAAYLRAMDIIDYWIKVAESDQSG